MHELLINNKISFIALSEQRPLSSSPLVLGHLVRYQTQLGIKGPRGKFGPPTRFAEISSGYDLRTQVYIFNWRNGLWAPQNSNLLYYILFQERVNRTWTVQNKIKETNPKPKKKAVTLFSVSLSLLQLSLQSLIFQNSFSQSTDRRTEQTSSLFHSKTLSFSTPLAVLDSLRRSVNNF